MTDNHIKNYRTLWADVNRPFESLTALEMAMTPHTLNKYGSIATKYTGHKYTWNDSLNLWMGFDS